MNDERHPGGGGRQISEPRSEGRVAVSRAGGISECRPPFDEADPSDSRDLVAGAHRSIVPNDLETLLEWTRRAVEDRSEVPTLVDELDAAELRALAARLVQLVGVLELCPPDVDPIYFIGRLAALAGDFAEDPWTASEADR